MAAVLATVTRQPQGRLIDIDQWRTAHRRYLKCMTQTVPNSTIVFYSKSGNSRQAARAIGSQLGADPVEVTTPNYKWPIFGYPAAGRDGMRGATAPLDQALDLPETGLVVLVGPVWAGGAAAPLNTVADALRSGQQRVAVLLTCGDKKEDPAPITKLAARLGRPLTASLVLSNAAQDSTDGPSRIAAFLQACLTEGASL